MKALRGPSGVATPDATGLAAYGRPGTAPSIFERAAAEAAQGRRRSGGAEGRGGTSTTRATRGAGRRRAGRHFQPAAEAHVGIEAAGPPGAADREGGRCGRGERLPQEDGPRRPQSGTREQKQEGPGGSDTSTTDGVGEGGDARAAGGGGAGGRARMGAPRDAPRRGTPAHRASVLNDDLLSQHDTAVRGPFLLLPLGHFTILDSWRCCSHSRGGRPQRRVPSRHYCRAEPLGAPAAILRARPASGGASHRAIRGGARPAPPT